jgi:hypothetical protein
LALSDRTTSVGSDEPLCLGTLLGLDVLEIAPTEPNLRMQKFWRMLPSIPHSMLFDDSAKLDVDGLRWAPVTFLRSPLNKDQAGGPSISAKPTGAPFMSSGILLERGLMVERPGLVVAARTALIGGTAYFRGENDKTWYHARCFHRKASNAVPYEFHCDGRPKSFGIKPGEWYGCEDIGIILDSGIAIAAKSNMNLSRWEAELLLDEESGHLVAI